MARSGQDLHAHDAPRHDHEPSHLSHGRAESQHTHGIVDPSIAASERGLWAVKWSFVGLILTAVLEMFVVGLSGSVALLADTIHNVGDAATAIPLGIAFLLGRRLPTSRFSFGLGRVEDLAGVAIVATIAVSALVAGYESVARLIAPQPVQFLGAVAVAAIIGFAGNETVAQLRIRVGKQINSVALIADGHHARTDGLTSLAVLASAAAVWAGFPIADPIIGLAITVVILAIVWQSARAILVRMLDGVDPTLTAEVAHVATHVPGVAEVADVRARWAGHRLAVEADIAVDPKLSVADGHGIAAEVRHQLLHGFPSLSVVSIHVDSAGNAGEAHHHTPAHAHNGFPVHSH